jgi:SOS-response transcriptional repressor LexA
MTDCDTPERATGFPSPAQGYEAKSLDFNELLVQNHPATFVMRAEGERFAHLGIRPGSLLVVDRSKPPQKESLVIIQQEGEFLCRRFGELTERCLRESVELFGTVTASITFL